MTGRNYTVRVETTTVRKDEQFNPETISLAVRVNDPNTSEGSTSVETNWTVDHDNELLMFESVEHAYDNLELDGSMAMFVGIQAAYNHIDSVTEIDVENPLIAAQEESFEFTN